jgi:ribosomal protein L29
MKKTDKISYRQKSPAELKKLISDLGKKLVDNKSKLTTGNLKDTSVLKKIRYEIAYVKTLIRQAAETNNDK